MLKSYLNLVRDCITSFKEEWNLTPAPSLTKKRSEPFTPAALVKPIEVKPILQKGSAAVPKASSASASEIEQLLEKIAPSVRLRKTLLDDTAATRIMQAWQEYVGEVDVILLAASRDKETLELIKSLAKNIEQKKGASAKALLAERIEQEKKWDLFLSKNQPKLLMASQGLMQMQNAMSTYKKNSATGQTFLGPLPLLVLSTPSLYAESVQEKITLWNTLCHLIKS